MKPFDAMLAEFVTPILRPVWLCNTRRTCRLAAPNGIQSLINFENDILSMSHSAFFVNTDVTVEAFRAWIHHGHYSIDAIQWTVGLSLDLDQPAGVRPLPELE
jgi:hypothetical protein